MCVPANRPFFLVMLLALGFLLLVSLIWSAGLAALSGYVRARLPLPAGVPHVAQRGVLVRR